MKVRAINSYGYDIEWLEHSDLKVFYTKKRALSHRKKWVKYILDYYLAYEEDHFKESDTDEREAIINKILSKAELQDYLWERFYNQKYLIVYQPDGWCGIHFSIMFKDKRADVNVERIIKLQHLLIND